MRMVYVVLDEIPVNYILVLTHQEADAWDKYPGVRRKLRRALKRRALEVSCPVVSVYRMESLIECWKIRSVDW